MFIIKKWKGFKTMPQIISARSRIKLNSLSPTRIIVSSFAIIILIGSILLNLPLASNDGVSIGYVNAVFTATSATCVTGLVIADTLAQWTLFGQIVIPVSYTHLRAHETRHDL